MTHNTVIIVAGGRGTRFGGPIPKQFLKMNGRPVLMHTIEAFATAGISNLKIIVTLPSNQRHTWRDLCLEHGFTVTHRVVDGGASRFESVRNAIAEIEAETGSCDGVIAVHDGVRPLVSADLIGRAFAVAASKGSAIPVVAVTDSVRRVNADGRSHTVPRSELRAVQTPQAFDSASLIAAYHTEPSDAFTDDASVYEAAGNSVYLIDGDTRNIKITHPIDIVVAEKTAENGRPHQD